METQTEQERKKKEELKEEEEPKCVMCGDDLVEERFDFNKREIVKVNFFYKDKNTGERLCRKHAVINEEIYRNRERGKVV